jgi:hypothetical protein
MKAHTHDRYAQLRTLTIGQSQSLTHRGRVTDCQRSRIRAAAGGEGAVGGTCLVACRHTLYARLACRADTIAAHALLLDVDCTQLAIINSTAQTRSDVNLLSHCAICKVKPRHAKFDT